MINVYTFLSHNKFYLPYQCKLIKQNIIDSKIIVIHDKNGPEINLSKEEIQEYKIDEVIETPSCSSQGFARNNWLMAWGISIAKGTALLMHGDILPLVPISETLLDGKQAVGTGGIGERATLIWRWILCTQEGRNTFDPKTFTWQADLTKIVPWDFDILSHFDFKNYDPSMRMEWLSGFLHCNNMSQPHFCPGSHLKKAFIESNFGMEIKQEPKQPKNAFELKRFFESEDNLNRLPIDLQNKIRELRGGCACHYTPWVKQHVQELNQWV